MDYIEGSNRDQLVLFPEALDEYVSEDNPVRFIDAFVESLGLRELGFSHAVLPINCGYTEQLSQPGE